MTQFLRLRWRFLAKFVVTASVRLASMNSGGTIEIAQRIAGHTNPSTTRIYDRSEDQLTLQEIERVQIGKKQQN
jgi:hypothetical protein